MRDRLVLSRQRPAAPSSRKRSCQRQITDAAHIVDTMREVLATVVAKPKRQVKRGEGPLHQINSASVDQGSGVRSGTISDGIVFDMFVELELMQRCSGLVFWTADFHYSLKLAWTKIA
jgi:hypothetical protein